MAQPEAQVKDAPTETSPGRQGETVASTILAPSDDTKLLEDSNKYLEQPIVEAMDKVVYGAHGGVYQYLDHFLPTQRHRKAQLPPKKHTHSHDSTS